MMQEMRATARRVIDLPARLAASFRHARIRLAPPERPMVSFGGVLESRRLVHGGAVKLVALRDHFETDESTCNILYLVSSAQARFAEDLVDACRRRGVRFVWNQNGVGYPGWAGADAERHNAAMRHLRAKADFVIYQSSFCRLCADKFLGPSERPGTVLFNPVDLQKFRPATGRPKSASVRLLAMGTQNYRDRVLSTMDCLRILLDRGIDSTLTIAGNLLWRGGAADVRHAIRERGLTNRIEMRPAFSQEEAAALYRRHDILLHPKYLDPCPTVVIEALASGLPVVGSASGGMPELVPPECGRLIDVPIDWERLITPTGGELAGAVEEILPDLDAMGVSARKHAEAQFGTEAWAARHAEIFRNLLA